MKEVVEIDGTFRVKYTDMGHLKYLGDYPTKELADAFLAGLVLGEQAGFEDGCNAAIHAIEALR
jgi:hypothetical protein